MVEQFEVNVNLSICNCSVCGVVYTLPCNMKEKRMENHDTFYCPNGHRQCFPGESREEFLGDLNQTLEYEKEKLQNQLRYWKGKANKVKK